MMPEAHRSWEVHVYQVHESKSFVGNYQVQDYQTGLEVAIAGMDDQVSLNRRSWRHRIVLVGMTETQVQLSFWLSHPSLWFVATADDKHSHNLRI